MRRVAFLLLILLLCPITSAQLTINQTADVIYDHSANETDYVRHINDYVNLRFAYESDGGWNVNAPEITWQIRKGDCSEFALLKTVMLTHKGIDARIVTGYLNGILHDDVEVHQGKYVTYLSEGFVKTEDGLHPQEKVIYG